MNLQHFANADTGSGGDTPPTDNPQGGTNPTGDTGKPEGGDTPPADPPTTKSYTQDDVNSLMTKTERKAQEKLLRKLGVENFDNAKDGLEKYRDWQESQKTEAQKLQDSHTALEQERNTAMQELGVYKTQVAVLKAGINADSVEDVVALADRLVNDDTTIEEAISQVIEKYPYFLKEQQTTQDDKKKPSYSTGQHTPDQKPSENDAWKNAFKF
ncbi:hypothetical protein BpsS140_00019 [Bacillus phage vB_BpsS-140]|nr:hypothetical protein BpsS140_00019 [Bacillus phage vB_BpsS-140]